MSYLRPRRVARARPLRGLVAMDAFVTLAISFGLLALIVFGMILSTFLMLVGVAFTLVLAGVPWRARVAPGLAPPRVASPVLFPRRRRGDWERGRAA